MPLKILSVLGARPEVVQAAPVSRAASLRGFNEVLVHTGQHYDYSMSQLFFEQLALREPDYNLQVGSGSHGRQTGEMIARLEEIMEQERPDWVIVRGDTNSTLAGAIAACKLSLPIAHIEAGARSFDRTMPEEINRVLVDHVSSLLFCIAPSAVQNLEAEGIRAGVHYVGDVMHDTLLLNLPLAQRYSHIHSDLGVQPGRYVLATVHRAANTDCLEKLSAILDALSSLGEPVVLPLHPRTRRAVEAHGLHVNGSIMAIDPVGYWDMLALEQQARVIATDSGGVTREAYLLGVPCVTLREETEHVETVQSGWNTLAGTDPVDIVRAVRAPKPIGPRPPIFGDGAAARTIVEILETAAPGLASARGGSLPKVAGVRGG